MTAWRIPTMSSPWVVLLHLCYNLDMARGKGLRLWSQYFGTGAIWRPVLWYWHSQALIANLWRRGRHQQEPEGQYEKSVVHVRVPPGQTPSSRACRTDQPWASGRNLFFPRSWDFRPAERANSPTNRFLRCQRQRASFLPRAFARAYPGHGSCGSALA